MGSIGMGGLGWALEIVLVILLGITLVHAIRLERALGILRRDRAAFGDAVAGFDSSTRMAEAGLGKLQSMAAEAAHLVAGRVERASALKDDLTFLLERGEALADRLDALVRSARVMPVGDFHGAEPAPKMRSQAERDLMQALRGGA